MIIKTGITKPSDNSTQFVGAEKIIVHEHWDIDHQINDIALIKVKHPIKFLSNISGHYTVNCLALPDSWEEPKGEAILAGWGELQYETGVSSDWLQKVTLPIVDRPTCREIYKEHLGKYDKESKIKVNKMHLCAGGAGGHDACRVKFKNK